jgi:hypothetical protein
MYGKTRAGLGLPALVDSDGVLLAPSGKFADAALNGRLFRASNQAAVATTAALATTWTGLGIANPTGSTKLLVIHEFAWGLSVVGPAAGALGLMTSTDSGFASAITPRCAYYGAGTSIAVVDDGATIATPVLERIVSTYGTGAITTWQGASDQVCKLEGGIVLPAGRSLLTYTFAATTAAFIFSFTWEEIDA